MRGFDPQWDSPATHTHALTHTHTVADVNKNHMTAVDALPCHAAGSHNNIHEFVLVDDKVLLGGVAGESHCGSNPRVVEDFFSGDNVILTF